GPIICPVLVKNRDTSLPWSARRAMASAGTGLRGLRVFFIKLALLLGGFPESYEVVIFAFLVLPHLKNDGVQVLSHPTACPTLLGPIRALVEVVGVRKDLLRLFEPDASLRIRS